MPAVLVFAVFLITLAFSVPIGIAMVCGALSPILFAGSGGNLTQLVTNSFSAANSTPILAVPLFIFGGIIMAEGGISKKLFGFFAYFVGRFSGGVPCAVVLTCLFYGAISGSGPATTAAVGAMCVPFMVSLGYERKWSAGMIAVAGGLGVIIPPSIPFVLYSLATGVSTGALFLAGILPGLLIGLALMIYAVIYCMRSGEDKALIKEAMDELASNGFGHLFLDSLPALLCPLIVLGGIYAGFVTPTEAACISVFYALIVALFIYRTISIKDIIPIMSTACRTYGGLAFVLAFAGIRACVRRGVRSRAEPHRCFCGHHELHHVDLRQPYSCPHVLRGAVPYPGHGYGHGPGHHHLGPHPAAGHAGDGHERSALRRRAGVLPRHRPGHPALWIEPIRNR